MIPPARGHTSGNSSGYKDVHQHSHSFTGQPGITHPAVEESLYEKLTDFVCPKQEVNRNDLGPRSLIFQVLKQKLNVSIRPQK